MWSGGVPGGPGGSQGSLSSQGPKGCWVGVDGALVAVLGVSDKVRTEAKEAVALLQSRGIKLVMLTGDNEGTARAVQTQLGLQHVKAKLLPEDKVSAVAELKDELGFGEKKMQRGLILRRSPFQNGVCAS